VRIEPFDAVTADEATALTYAEIVADAHLSATPNGLREPVEFVLNTLRARAANRRTMVHAAYDGETLVAASDLTWMETPDNRNRAWLHFDLPGAFDEALVDALARAAAEASSAVGRPLLNLEIPAESPYSAWAKARGAKLGSVEQHNVTRLAELSRDDLAAIVAAVPAGYELVSFDGPTPPELVEPYSRLVETMNDAPRDDLTMEDFVFDPEQLRLWDEGQAARGHIPWTVIAREAATGELAAFNQLIIRPEWPECIENEDTAVAVKHRGHGLGLWIKSVNLLRAVTERPEAVCVETWNAASNEHMLRVNRRLGFVCEHVFESWELDASGLLA
jgi:GNAT superfamily N-acetyltransferase